MTADAPVQGFIDVHGHLLPGIDDGCADTREAVECARHLVEAGYAHAFCTPHVEPKLRHNNAVEIPAAVARLQQEFDRAGVGLRLHAGGENHLGRHSPATPPDDLVLMAGGLRVCFRTGVVGTA